MNSIDFDEIQRLRKENEELKALIKEGKEKFEKIKDILNIKEIANMNMLFVKLPLIIRSIQNNPELIQEILNYLEKLKKYENT